MMTLMSEITRRGFAASGLAPLLAAPAPAADAIPERRLLTGQRTAETIASLLIAPRAWKPYPQRADRAAWEAVPPQVRESVLAAASHVKDTPYPPLPATLFLQFARNGNRSHYEDVWTVRRTHLRLATLAECLEGKGRFLDDIADGIWTVCEETFWGYPAHISAQKRGAGLPDVTEPIIDLFAAETAAQLAWTLYLIGPALDQVHPLVRERVAVETERRIFAPYRDRDDFWWMGFDGSRAVNNWNPWINSNCLAAFLLLETNESRRARAVHKIIRGLDRFLDAYHDDGGCDEGPSYWSRAGGSLFDNLELLHSATGGRLDYYSVPLVREIGRYIYRAHIADHWFVNFADASARIQVDSDLVYRYGVAIADRDMQSFAAYSRPAEFRLPDSLGRDLPAIFNYATLRKAEARAPLVRDVWLPGVQVAAARSRAGTTAGLYFAALGGHNAESHNHNDVGNFILFADGEPVLIDIGVETYSAKTFSPQRYDIWTMQSSYHNLPAINGVMQHEGRRYEARDCAYRSDDKSAEFSADIAAAYPDSAGITRYFRTIRLDRVKNELFVEDRFELAKAGGAIEMNLMTRDDPAPAGPAALTLGGRGVRFQAEGPSVPAMRVEQIAVNDRRLRPVWGDKLRRIVLSWRGLPTSGSLVFRFRA